MNKNSNSFYAWRIRISGTVQGVGFRPFVYRCASTFGITGTVRNDHTGVVIEVFGSAESIKNFLNSIISQAPPLAHIKNFDKTEIDFEKVPERFEIIETTKNSSNEIDITCDASVCETCLAEMRDPLDRRYKHAFINCTDCGPRYTIINQLPYDRSSTTMSHFTMCDNCAREYNDPTSRRFHAQPICCPHCGPTLSLIDNSGNRIETTDPIRATALSIEQGNIVAIKGIGGFHLAARADDSEIVKKLRTRKARNEKPFALMVRSIEIAHQIAQITPDDERLLTSTERPIVLVNKKIPSPVANEVAPNVHTFGLLLPYTPLHHLLFDQLTIDFCIMTSANISDEPMVYDDTKLIQTLGPIADYFLTHNRSIFSGIDDSITQIVDKKPLLLRRGRGYVPEPVAVPFSVDGVVGCGGVLKSSVAIGRGDSCYVSQYCGTLDNTETVDRLISVKNHLLSVLEVSPRLFVGDLHPESASHAIVSDNVPFITVQHHHAHAAACLAENGHTEKAICVVYDGTGYGEDGTIWGGEIFIGDIQNGFTRKAHWNGLVMPGGDMATIEPWRLVVGAFSSKLQDKNLHALFPMIAPDAFNAITALTINNVNCPRTSSMGRLFDACSALLGVGVTRSYEGQPAISLENAVEPGEYSPYLFTLDFSKSTIELPAIKVLENVYHDRNHGVPFGIIAYRFHETIIRMTIDAVIKIANDENCNAVCLSGGCFQNAILSARTSQLLNEKGFTLLTHRIVPPNDESISLGQVVLGARRYFRETL